MYKKRNLIISFIMIVGIFLVFYKLDSITDFTSAIISSTPKPVIDKPNEYSYDLDYEYVQKSKDFVPYSKQDIKNIFYSILDNGYDNFTFYCPNEYTDCLKDVEEISNNQEILTSIGNFVHPFNSFTNIKVVTDTLGEVNVIVTKLYNEKTIDDVNNKLDEIFKEILTDDMKLEDKILTLHDYIIDNTSYDTEEENINSGNAYGLLFNGKVKCSGYADTMAIILAKLGVKNFKIASNEHVWNAVYLNDEWSHLDLTWDDPILVNGNNITDTIRHKFYMIDTKTLSSYETNEHNFDTSIYLEFR